MIFAVAVFLYLIMMVNVAVYEYVFIRCAKESPGEAVLTETSLAYESVTFQSAQKTRLTGYLIQPEGESCRKTVILSRGMNAPLKDYDKLVRTLTENGFRVFTYDYKGALYRKSMGGLPEAIIDLEGAISYIRSNYPDDELCLVGHSLGGYASGAILPFVDSISAAVLIAPFDRSSDMLEWNAKQYVGFLAHFFLPLARGYETLKFGRYSIYTVTDGALLTDVPILILQGEDDTVVPLDFGISHFESSLSGDSDVSAELLDDVDHSLDSDGIPYSEIVDYLLQ